MPRILLEVITYKLSIDPKYKLIQQKNKNFASKRQKIINEKIDKLLAINFIREAHYPD